MNQWEVFCPLSPRSAWCMPPMPLYSSKTRRGSIPRHRDRGLETRPTGPPLLLTPPLPLRPVRFWFRGFSVPQPPVASSGWRLRQQLGAWGLCRGAEGDGGQTTINMASQVRDSLFASWVVLYLPCLLFSVTLSEKETPQ